jgi:hypothetical protein
MQPVVGVTTLQGGGGLGDPAMIRQRSLTAVQPASWPLRNRRMDWQSSRHDVSGLKEWPAIQRRRSWLGGEGMECGDRDSSEGEFQTCAHLDGGWPGHEQSNWTRQDGGENI